MKQIDNTPIEDLNIDWGNPDGNGKKAKSLEQVQAFLKKKLNEGYKFISTATLSTTPVNLTGDEKVFYIATEEGDYTNFELGNINELSVIKSENVKWSVEGLGVLPSDAAIALLYSDNLLIAKDMTVEGNFNNTTGDIQPSFSQYGWVSSSHYITIKPNTSYKRIRKNSSIQSKMVVYDANFNFIESFPDVDEFTTPPNACYAKFSATSPYKIAYYLATSELTEVVEGDYPTIESKSGIPIKGSSLTESDKNIWDKKTIFLTGSSTVAIGKFQQIISDKTGADIITNGLPGRTVHYFAFHSSGSGGEFDRLITAEDLAGVDVIVICGYTNNLWGSLGSMDDDYVTISQAEAESYTDISSYASSISGAYIPSLRSVVEYYLSIAPQIPIIISGQLPVSRPKEAWNGQTNNVDFKRVYNGSGKTAEDFSNATKEVAEYYSLPFVDMHHNGQVNIINYATYYSGNDTSHPNFKDYDSTIGDYPISGMKIMAMGIIESLKKII